MRREHPLVPRDTVGSETQKAEILFQKLGFHYGTRAQTAIRFALTNAGISAVICGLASLSQLEEAIEAQKMGPLPDQTLHEIFQIYEGGFE